MLMSSLQRWHNFGFILLRRNNEGVELQVSTEKTVFMQKAIYYVSRLIAARGIIELTDRNLNFQVAPFDSSFGIKDLTIPICTIMDVRIEGGERHPKVVVVTEGRKHEFVLVKGQELYDGLKEIWRDPIGCGAMSDHEDRTAALCTCGRKVNRIYNYCPWCGAKV
jgi:hypothetical protein